MVSDVAPGRRSSKPLVRGTPQALTRRRATRFALSSTLAASMFVVLAAPPAQAAWWFPNSRIADNARSYTIGSVGGQCKPFAAKVVNTVLASHGIDKRVTGYYTGGAYYQAYINGGGTLVAVNDVSGARPGDLIQTINKDQVHSDFPTTRGLHTAIVVARTGTVGTVTVRDSNWYATTAPEKIYEHDWTPVSWASARNANTYLWTSCSFRGSWGPSWQGRAEPASGEHGHGDERLG